MPMPTARYRTGVYPIRLTLLATLGSNFSSADHRKFNNGSKVERAVNAHERRQRFKTEKTAFPFFKNFPFFFQRN
jgi:hypothetical protein